MNNEKTIAGLLVVFCIVGILATSIGLTSDTINSPSETVLSDSGLDKDVSFWDAVVAAVMVPIRFVINAIGSIIQLMTFQVEGIPGELFGVFMLGISGYILLVMVRLIRGGG